ncbi:MAG TPA: Hsp20/alpha crystallin family protein [Verrucomicrobiae bacterium]|nr:Hsp20/alpha crystallin family protein [Verrucomicrobiae bacterium]
MAKTYDQHLHESLAYLSLPALASHSAWTPNTDVYETPDALVVKMEIAGIDKNDLEITLNDRLLLVRGHRKDPCRQKRCSFRQMEIDYGYFERRIVIPRSVDGSRVRAQFQNGFLHIELPKSPTSEHTAVTIIIEQTG